MRDVPEIKAEIQDDTNGNESDNEEKIETHPTSFAKAIDSLENIRCYIQGSDASSSTYSYFMALENASFMD